MRLSVLVTHSQNCDQELERPLRRAVVMNQLTLNEPDENERHRCGTATLWSRAKKSRKQKLSSPDPTQLHEDLHEHFMKLIIKPLMRRMQF
jgi:hypothetical protein